MMVGTIGGSEKGCFAPWSLVLPPLDLQNQEWSHPVFIRKGHIIALISAPCIFKYCTLSEETGQYC